MSLNRVASSILIAAACCAASPAFAHAHAQTATAPSARLPASAEERAAYNRLDPLARSVFWSREM